MARVRRSDPNGPGLRRRRCGRGFSYLDADGSAVSDQEVLARIRDLAIPPAWRDVWICAAENGHIQAVYHDVWRAQRDAAKFDRVLSLAERLPRLRRRISADLTAGGEQRVLAATVRLLDLGTFRIGNPEYADEHDTFGLTTLQRRHVNVHRDEIRFSYTAKYGMDRVEVVHDRSVADVIRALRRRRARADEPVFGWRQGGRWCPLRSDKVNEYLQDVAGMEVTAKDFRTWHATVLMAVALAAESSPRSKTASRRAIASAYRTVSDQLGNTPSVVKASYVDPRLLDLYRDGTTIDLPRTRSSLTGRSLRTIERAVLTLLRSNSA
jgi:DNA topoisomerase IB